MRIWFVLLLLAYPSINFAQKIDVRVEIYDLKEDVKKLQSENQKLSTDLSTSIIKYENRILDLGAKIEDLRFEINVLKRILEQYRNGSITSNPTANSTSAPTSNNSNTEQSTPEKSESKPKYQSSSQCSATTKKGTRCSRSARSNGLCWQHGG
jgi:predicted RNase H-like nuclease (RuvC/YqgF family)